jgi:hypothetical protein
VEDFAFHRVSPGATRHRCRVLCSLDPTHRAKVTQIAKNDVCLPPWRMHTPS